MWLNAYLPFSLIDIPFSVHLCDRYGCPDWSTCIYVSICTSVWWMFCRARLTILTRVSRALVLFFLTKLTSLPETKSPSPRHKRYLIIPWQILSSPRSVQQERAEIWEQRVDFWCYCSFLQITTCAEDYNFLSLTRILSAVCCCLCVHIVKIYPNFALSLVSLFPFSHFNKYL